MATADSNAAAPQYLLSSAIPVNEAAAPDASGSAPLAPTRRSRKTTARAKPSAPATSVADNNAGHPAPPVASPGTAEPSALQQITATCFGEKPMVALVLQGGGALGAYHIGAFQALEEAGIQPDWISGISIGAVNAAILAGNPPELRLRQLDALWEAISRPDIYSAGQMRHAPLAVQRYFNTLSALQAICFGQPNFFTPRFPNPWLLNDLTASQAGFYDTAPLLETLQALSNFELINQHFLTPEPALTDSDDATPACALEEGVLLSLGATNVTTGELTFFNNWQQEITPQHVLASGSLPPGFPAVEIEGQWYWDGGCVSNTPLEAILKNLPDRPLLVFMVDLWSAEGAAPTTMDEVSWRQKQIQYASRSAAEITRVTHELNMCRSLQQAGVPHEVPVHLARYLKFGHSLDIVHITYCPGADEIASSDAEFSRTSIADRRAAGLRDMRAALEHAPWKSLRPRQKSASCHKVKSGLVEVDCFRVAGHSGG
ncbi:patatin-like phospholipase family protein [Pokkaliibacter sp. MBI-7]|uniref:patatin-like phospholipase family protein n=1 Tax=Pokkaliibacter sp. MBI-7 TaxID=3040600 RepID=UPI002448E370|nr:patatin-like phospholipase family protein [Pokkaliibacter sp. MBI-7]MDH2434466.1 patatin-like phospholipase family protein [Pokkaliibacter sp. MBI-7]